MIYRHLIFFTLLFAAAFSAKAQKDHFAKLTASAEEVMAGQPFNVEVTVFTPTWFTKAPDFGDYNLKGAFTVRTGRPLGNHETLNGKRYTTLNYSYTVFPMMPGDLDLPALDFNFESPLEGDYKGKRVNVKTNAKKIKVLHVPDTPEGIPAFVAKDVSILQNWNIPLTNLKIGDVIEQTLTIDAVGTLANIIPPTDFDTIVWASRYSRSPKLLQSVTEKPITATRIETYTWLLEKPGTFKTPAIIINWYDLDSKKWKSNTIAPVEIEVADNPNLAMLKSLQDSLMMSSQHIAHGESDNKMMVFGLSIQQLILAIIFTGLFIVFIIFSYRKISYWRQKNQEEYLSSEQYFFDELVRSFKSSNLSEVNSRLYAWIDHLNRTTPIHNVSELAQITNNISLQNSIANFQKSLFGNGQKKACNEMLRELFTDIKKSRNSMIAEKSAYKSMKSISFNP